MSIPTTQNSTDMPDARLYVAVALKAEADTKTYFGIEPADADAWYATPIRVESAAMDVLEAAEIELDPAAYAVDKTLAVIWADGGGDVERVEWTDAVSDPPEVR